MASKSNSKKKNNGKKKGGKGEQFDTTVSNELLIIAFLAIAILLFLCNFGTIGPVGDVISKGMFGLFGLLAYIFPLVLFGQIAFGLINQGSVVARIRIICTVVIFLFVSVLIQLWGGNVNDLVEYDVKVFFENGVSNHAGGGVIGGSLAYFMHHYLDTTGTVLLSIVLILISMIIITGKSLIRAIKDGGMHAYEDVKEYRERVVKRYDDEEEYEDDPYDYEEQKVNRRDRKAPNIRELAREKEKEKEKEADDSLIVEEPPTSKQLRRNRKATGVNMDGYSSDKKTSSFDRNDMHEISIKDIGEAKSEKAYAVSRQPFDDLADVKIHGIKEEAPQDTKNEADSYNSGMDEIRFNTAKADKQTDIYDSEHEVGEIKASITASKSKPRKKYVFPAANLLNKIDKANSGSSKEELMETARTLQDTLETFGVKAKVTDISQGPSVTRYELQPEPGVRVNKIVQLSDDIKYALAATDVRIEAPIPGKSAVGIEVPNKVSTGVGFRELVESAEFKKFDSKIAFAVGKDISGNVVVADIAKMPHMLIAGATGSGKSVCINTIIMSILYKASPDEVKLIMIDPKVVELSVYNGIPHLMVPVVTDPKKAAAALHWGVAEMTDRYQKFAEKNVRDLKGYNKVAEEKLPQIVIIVDELADLMMVAAKEVEESICRIAQLARACGIHLIIATQRPSVDVITGLIKANMPSRVAFAVSSGVDSRTILDMNGAEKLLGKGDMLFYPQGYPKPARMQGAFISDGEVSRIVDFLKDQNLGEPYQVEMEEALKAMSSAGGSSISGGDSGSDFDELLMSAGNFIIDSDKASIGALQRKFKIGFNRAARIMDQLCELGVVSEEQGTKPRNILMGPEEFQEIVEEYL